MAPPILSTLVYCYRNDRVLLMFRHKEPNRRLWVAPGGKIEPGESPHECAQRELQEETGLCANALVLRGLVTEVLPTPHDQWLHFIYVATEVSGELGANHREGELRWWPAADVLQLPIPQADRVFFPKIIDVSLPLYEARLEYDGNLDLIRVVEHSS